MNILLLYADDWRHDTLGCAGNAVVKTPTIDALAKQGVRFTHNCVTTSICGISRANLYTGHRQVRHHKSQIRAAGNFYEQAVVQGVGAGFEHGLIQASIRPRR